MIGRAVESAGKSRLFYLSINSMNSVKTDKPVRLIVTAGGTGGHIFPALSVVLALRQQRPAIEIVWIGTSRSREEELCRLHGIRLVKLAVSGIKRRMSIQSVKAVVQFVMQIFSMVKILKRENPVAVIAFGGYVSAPVLAAARLSGISYFCQEQNTVPGLVNRLFARKARAVFISFPLAQGLKLKGTIVESGMPIRTAAVDNYASFVFPVSFVRSRTTILITGGSQGAQQMNRTLIAPVRNWAQQGLQIVWHTGEASYNEVQAAMHGYASVMSLISVPDLYPFYAVAKILIARSGASTMAESALFGLPAVFIPLPWAAENHQWMNAGIAVDQDWAIRISQDDSCSSNVRTAVQSLLTDTARYNSMSTAARAHSSAHSAATIAARILQEVAL